MFKENHAHEQPVMFKLENDFDNRLKKRLLKHWSTNFYRNVFNQIDERIFSPLYSKNGRGNFPVNIFVGMEILKELHSITDEELFDRYTFDLSFRRALGLNDFNEYVLCERTFYYFRSSVAQYELDHNENLMMTIFKDLRDEYINALGIKTAKQRTDSTQISANIKKMNRLALFHKVLSNLVERIKTINEIIPEEVKNLLQKDEDNFCYRLKSEEYESKTIEIADHICRLLDKYREDERVNVQKCYAQARRVIDEQCRVAEIDAVELKPSTKVSSSSMQNPADDDATYRKKNNVQHYGYAAHATETCDPENEVQIITDIDLVANNEDDAAVLTEKIETLKEETGLETMIVDGGYVSESVRSKCEKNEVELVATAIRGKSVNNKISDALTSIDFVTDEKTGEIIKCPQGHAPRNQKVEGKKVTANFDPKKCSDCEKKVSCPAYKSQKQSRIVIDETRRWIDQRTELLKSPEYRKLCKLRPAVEGLMSCIKPKYLKGRILFRGKVKTKNRMILKAMAINCKRIWAKSLKSFCDFFIQPIFFRNSYCILELAKKVC